MRKKIVAFDFDGTVSDSKFLQIGPPIMPVINYLKELRKNNWILILWTCREDKYLWDAMMFCKEHDIYPDFINENADYVDLRSRKIFADLYIDDKSIDITLNKPITNGLIDEDWIKMEDIDNYVFDK